MKEYDLISNNNTEEFYREFEARRAGNKKDVTGVVQEIISEVAQKGDEALYRYGEKFDGVDLRTCGLEEPVESTEIPRELDQVIRKAADNIRAFHEKEREHSWELRRPGVQLGIKITPMERVGVYVPGGSASLPSSVLMNVIPAKVAGVGEIIMCTPPNKEGGIDPVIKQAAYLAGVDRIYKIGGAQAIAAMAYGTETVPKADKITGPGNAYVAAAKRCVFGKCGIDMIAGPSEILIVADDSAEPEYVAADMLSQAEHDPMAAAVLITDSRALADRVQRLVIQQLDTLSRKEIAAKSIEDNGAVILVEDMCRAMEICNFIAAEHLELCVKEPEQLLDQVVNAGAVFLGNYSPEPMGDYFCGTNHILPTGGSARFSSPLGVWDFLKRTSVIHYRREGFLAEAEAAAQFAASEKLTAHENSIRIRLRNE